LRIATDEEAAMTEPDAGTGQQQQHGQHRAGAAGGPDTTMSLHAISATDSVETPESGLSPADRTAIEALPGGSALLVVQRGPNSGARFLLDAERTTAGRRPDSDIFLDDVTVSRRHAEFVRRSDGSFVVRDVGSLNGTYVQRDRIDEVVLRDGDEVQIGKYRMVFHPSPRSGGAGAGW
jgi:pSer/pThr/pTyr-binding forkhead associated (FHA) protein